MAKIRALKPEFFTDENVVELSPLARLLFQGLWIHACDNGHVEDRPKQLKMRILPADDCDVAELLAEIIAQRMAVRADGWLTVPKLGVHQKIDRRFFLTCNHPGCEESDGAQTRGSGARFGNHKRWHVGRGIVDEDCEFCPTEPESDPIVEPSDSDVDPSSTRRAPIVGTTSDPSSNDNDPSCTHRGHDVDPSSTRRAPIADGDGDGDGDGDKDQKTSSDVSDDPTPPERPDVEAMLDYLDARIAAEGVRKPPNRTKASHDAARRMLDRDGYDPHEIRQVIDWATRSEFWAPNIGCASKLREKYQTLRAQMRQPARASPGASPRQQQTDDLFAAAMARAEAGTPNPFTSARNEIAQ